MRHRTNSRILVLMVAVILTACTVALSQRALPNLDTEIAMGRETAREIEQRVRWIQDPVVTEYINRVSQTLVRNSDAVVPFTIRVVDSDEVNVMALPGGFLFVNKGLILATDNEAELAGVIAHEIAHVTARHAARQAQGGDLLRNGVPGIIVQQAASIGVPITFIAFNRGAETEADSLGLQYLAKAGYDPAAMVRSFQKLRASKVSNLFSTHTAGEERLAQVQQNIAANLPARTQAPVSPAEFDAVKARLR